MKANDSGLRIAHVQPMSLDLFGHEDMDIGTKTRYFLTNIAVMQARMGDRPTIHLLTSCRPHKLQFDNVEVFFHSCFQPPRSSSLETRFGRQLSVDMLRAIQREQADVVHFHGVRSMHAMFAAVAWRARREFIPLVAQEQGSRLVGRCVTEALKYSLRHAQAILAANSESIPVFVDFGVQRDRIHLIPNGVDLTMFHPGPPAFESPESPFKILIVSRLSAEKDPLTAVDGIAELARRGRRIATTIIGRGPLRDECERRLRAASVPFVFIDHVPQNELPMHYRAAHAMVLTSLAEGFSQVTIEAMACGIPVVATDVAGIRDGVGRAGVLIPSQNPVALSNALEQLMDDSHARLRYRELSLARVRPLGWSEITKQIRSIYLQLLPGGDSALA